MRYLRYLFLAAFCIVLVVVAMANRESVTLRLVPEELADYASMYLGMNPSVDLPLYVVIFGGIVVGLALGFIWEWFREHAIRSEAAQKAREVRRLERENKRLKAERPENQGDDVLALLDEAR